MSHFSVLICLPASTPLEKLEEEIEQRMAPWDENRRVAPYRSYEDKASPEQHWSVTSARRDAEAHNADALVEIRESFLDRDGMIYRNGSGYVTRHEYIRLEKEQRAEGAKWAERLGEHPTWETVVNLYNERFGHGPAAVAVPGEDDEIDTERMYYEPETNRAYAMSTYNPESKWDYWRIGGRWRGYFRVKADAPGVIRATRSWDSPDDFGPGIRADGARKGLIDLDAMRADAAEEAHRTWDAWEALVRDAFGRCEEPAKSWEHFYGLKEAGELSIEAARNAYHDQPFVQRLRKISFDKDAPRSLKMIAWADDPVREFGSSTREEYVAEQRNAAVPGYALVTLDGEWVAPGRMGWWGMSSDGPGEREGYHIAVNKYLDDAVSDDDFVVVLDCHI